MSAIAISEKKRGLGVLGRAQLGIIRTAINAGLVESALAADLHQSLSSDEWTPDTLADAKAIVDSHNARWRDNPAEDAVPTYCGKHGIAYHGTYCPQCGKPWYCF